MAKILGKTHKPKVLGADTHSVSLSGLNICRVMTLQTLPTLPEVRIGARKLTLCEDIFVNNILHLTKHILNSWVQTEIVYCKNTNDIENGRKLMCPCIFKLATQTLMYMYIFKFNLYPGSESSYGIYGSRT